MRIDDPKSNQIRALKRLPIQLAAGSPLGNTSVSQGQTQFLGLLSILVEGSGLVTGLWDVDGELRIGGTLNGDGTLNWSGPWNMTGPGSIAGDVDVAGDFEIVSGGLFRAGFLTISPGGTVTGATGLIFNPGGIMSINGATNITGTLSNPGHGTTGSSANTFINTGTGLISRVTSSTKYKLLPEVVEIPDALLDVPIEWWFDRGPIERYVELAEAPRPLTELQQLEMDSVSFRRIPGVIAEKVAAAGGEAFVTYDADGDIDGLAYDRLALARTAVAAQRTAALEERIVELTRRLEELESSLGD